ncbi:MAG TPA: hypothetical protein VN033_09510 [Vulgatibacter sp.]|nr:hypothetical protein [Vulgatibacter sp.]
MTEKPRDPLRRLPLMLMICGFLGVMGVAFGASGLMSWREPIPEMPVPTLPAAPPGEEAAWEQIQAAIDQVPEVYREVMQERRPAVTALAAANLVASAVLLVGSLSARLRRPSALRTLRAGLTLSQAYAVLSLVVQTWVQLGLLGGQRILLAAVAAQGGMARAMAVTLTAGQVAVVILTAVAALAQLAFFVWASRLLRRPGVAEAISGAPGPGLGVG